MGAHDIFSDKQLKILNLVRTRAGIPEFAKEASVTEDEVEGLPDSCFAWPEKRAFPIDSKANAFLSSTYFLCTSNPESSAIPEHVHDNLDSAADLFGIKEDLLKVASQFKDPKTITVSPEDFGLYYRDEDTVVKKYPLMDGDMVKAASEHFENHYSDFSLEDRRTISDNILLKAAQFGVVLDTPNVFKFSGCMGNLNKEKLIDEVEKRAYRNQNTPFHEPYLELSEKLKGVDSYDVASVRGLQETLVGLDKQAGIDRYYGRHYENPYEALYSSDADMGYLQKTAEQTVNVGDTPVPLTSLLGVPPSLYEDVLGSGAKHELMTGDSLDPVKLSSVLPTLPKPEAAFLVEQLKASGVA